MKERQQIYEKFKQNMLVEKVLVEFAKANVISDVRLYVDAVMYLASNAPKVLVVISTGSISIDAFVVDLPTMQVSGLKNLQVQATKGGQRYVMADMHKFELKDLGLIPIQTNYILQQLNSTQNPIRPSGRDKAYFKSLASTSVVNEETGIVFNVNIEQKTENYVKELNRRYPNNPVEIIRPLVSFYDTRYFIERNGVGQFVSEYLVDTFLEGTHGIILEGGIDDWRITAENRQEVNGWIKELKRQGVI